MTFNQKQSKTIYQTLHDVLLKNERLQDLLEIPEETHSHPPPKISQTNKHFKHNQHNIIIQPSLCCYQTLLLCCGMPGHLNRFRSAQLFATLRPASREPGEPKRFLALRNTSSSGNMMHIIHRFNLIYAVDLWAMGLANSLS